MERVNKIFGHLFASQVSVSVSIRCFAPVLAEPLVIEVKTKPSGRDCPLASPKIPYNSYAAAFVFPMCKGKSNDKTDS